MTIPCHIFFPPSERLHPNASRRIIRSVTMKKTPAGSGSQRRLLLPRCRARPVRENYGRSALPPDTQAAFSFGRDSAGKTDNVGLVAARSAGMRNSGASTPRWRTPRNDVPSADDFASASASGSAAPPSLTHWRAGTADNDACFVRSSPPRDGVRGCPGTGLPFPPPRHAAPFRRFLVYRNFPAFALLPGISPASSRADLLARFSMPSPRVSSAGSGAPRVCSPRLTLRISIPDACLILHRQQAHSQKTQRTSPLPSKTAQSS